MLEEGREREKKKRNKNGHIRFIKFNNEQVSQLR